jgi:predicted CXXCH cytochrome family protein
MKVIITCAICILAIVLNISFGKGTKTGDNKCLECHAKLLDQKIKHIPVEEDCKNCHKPTGKTHPDKNEKGFTLTLQTPELCNGCHKNTLEAKFQHIVATDEKNCLHCHSVHSSPEKKLLVKGNKDLCLSCHNKTYTAEKKTIVNIKQLLETSKYIHTALNGGCKSCHKLHDGANEFLLMSPFPKGIYAPANQDTMALCFECHDTDILDKATTSNATGFRNGEKNLHYLHLRGDPGRNCTICHDVHASGNMFMILDNVQFGKWMMPINFKPGENGGSCAPGCHSEKQYSR